MIFHKKILFGTKSHAELILYLKHEYGHFNASTTCQLQSQTVAYVLLKAYFEDIKT